MRFFPVDSEMIAKRQELFIAFTS